MTQNNGIQDNDKGPAETGRSLPENIAAEAGLPRGGAVPHNLHGASDRGRDEVDIAVAVTNLHGTATHTAHDTGAGIARETSGTAGGNLRDRAADAASQAESRLSDAADTARDRVQDLRGRASDTYEDLRGRASDRYDDARNWAEDRYDTHRQQAADFADRGYRRLQEGRTATEQFVSENPLLVGVVGLAAGLLLGALLPRTRSEDRALGPWADDLRDQGLRYARDVTHRGREFVETALDPNNLDAAVKRASAPEDADDPYKGPERTAHTL